MQWVGADGTVRSGHEAIAAVLGTAGRFWRVCGRVLTLPGISWIAAQRLPAGRATTATGCPAALRPAPSTAPRELERLPGRLEPDRLGLGADVDLVEAGPAVAQPEA